MIHLKVSISSSFQIKFNLRFFLISKSACICLCINEKEIKANFILLVYELPKSLKPVQYQLSEEGSDGPLAPNSRMFAGQQVRGLWEAGRLKTLWPHGDKCQLKSTCLGRSKQPLLTAGIIIVLEFRPSFSRSNDFPKEAKNLEFYVKPSNY